MTSEATPELGMFRRYEAPMRHLTSYPAISDDQLLMHLTLEAERRLAQIERFYEEARRSAIEAVSLKFVPPTMPDPADLDKMDRAVERACDAAEAFYVFGFRIYDITRDIRKRLNFSQTPRPRHFCDVRNHLILHPESLPERQRVIPWSAFVSGNDGRYVVLKNARPDGDEGHHQDPGLKPNALELQAYLRAWIIETAELLNPRPPGL